jgi:nitroimidazol reductase NimA-like FMN-containing flavoprotein (pyridoxamine 5'-phosphate oxidase superfamily)
MTLDNAAWPLLDRGGRLETLDRDECRRRLGSTTVGRLGYCTDFGPRIVPMNYTLVSESVTRHLTSFSIIRLPSKLIRLMNSSRWDGACLSWETLNPWTRPHCYFSM